MATGKGLVCKLEKHIPIDGADKIVSVDMFGETIITQKTNIEGAIGILFDMETCLSHEYASRNNMYRHSHLNVDDTVVGYLEDDRRIRPIKLKGVKVSGLWMPIESLEFRSTDKGKYPLVGFEIDSFDGVNICEKYVSKSTRSAMSQGKNNKISYNKVPTFKEHIDTEQWARNKHLVKYGSQLIITEKLHGTSGRCGYLLVEKENPWWKNLLLTWIRGRKITHTLDYEFVVGSRRVVKSIGLNEEEKKNHFYDQDLWTIISQELFEGKLRKGETIYYEIVGYSPSGESIMSPADNRKLEKFLDKSEYKNFISKYGETTSFNYGCSSFPTDDLSKRYKVFIYRITMTNEDGDSIDYTWDQVKTRSTQLGVNHVPELDRFEVRETHINLDETSFIVDELTNDQSKMFPQHVREGVCIRIDSGSMTPTILKSKSYVFKVLEGIIKDSDKIDIEESN
jgi:hypothetical protein